MKQIESAAKAHRRSLRWSGMVAGLGCLLSSGLVGAVEKGRYDVQGAAGVCQPSAPQYETNLRSRPLGLANQGTEIAFVTCACREMTPLAAVARNRSGQLHQ